MQKSYKSFKDAVNGFKTAIKEERNFKIEILSAFFIIFCIFFFGFSSYEVVPLVISIFAVITAEIINTVVEDLCDKIEPGHDKVIGKIKDMMAAYVLLTVIGSIVIGLLVFYSHFFVY